MKRCENCGTRMGSICSWCHEELYIETYQTEFMEGPYSPEWDAKVAQQRREIAASPTNQEGGS